MERSSAPSPRLSLRVDLGRGRRIGPGKVALLEAVAATGSITAAARTMRMSYRRAWTLIDAMNQEFGPVVTAQSGGAKGGGSGLTARGAEIVARYRAIEAAAMIAAEAHLRELGGLG